MEEEAVKGAFRLESNNQWIYEPMVNKKGNLTTHTKLNEQLPKAISLNSEGKDQQTASMNADIGFTTEISRLSEYEVIENGINTIQCYTDSV